MKTNVKRVIYLIGLICALGLFIGFGSYTVVFSFMFLNPNELNYNDDGSVSYGLLSRSNFSVVIYIFAVISVSAATISWKLYKKLK